MFHLRKILKSVSMEDSKLMKHFSGEVNYYDVDNRQINGIASIAEYLSTLLQAIPDIVWNIHDYKIMSLSHIPSSFKGFAHELYRDGLNSKLYAKILNSTPIKTPGLVIIGKYSVSGTKLYEIATEDNSTLTTMKQIRKRENEIITKSVPEIFVKGTFVWVLNYEDKVARFEQHYTDRN